MMDKKKYKATFFSCYTASICQAAVINLTPLLFVPLRVQYGFSYAQLGALVLVNFLTQLAADIGCSPLIDRLGFRFFAVLGHILTVLGFGLFALVPVITGGYGFLPEQTGAPVSVYGGFIAATVLFSFGGGCLELITSPIMNSLPARDKSASMSFMHSFYCWGQVGVALFATLFLLAFGTTSWPYLYLIWLLLPLANTFVLLRCPMGKPVPAEKRSSAASIMKSPQFIILILIIMSAGASELTLSQWTSAFMEEVMALPKAVGDIAGMCLFAVMMGAARLINGLKGSAAGLRKRMLWGGALAFVCYLLVANTSSAVIGLAACALCGLGVSLLWPGSLSLADETFPLAGSWMMAIMAAAGDAGGSLGPWLAGVAADGLGLRVSLMLAAVFPLAVTVLLAIKPGKRR